jgi:tetratricopeptide (TPR) repeat protein
MHDINHESENASLRHSSVGVEALLKRGLEFHKTGRLTDAEAIYRQILSTTPSHFEALYLLGILAYQRGNYVDAVRQIDRALEVNPEIASAHRDRGVTLHLLKRFDEALASHDRAIALKPDYAIAFINRGLALQELNRLDEALASYDQAIVLQPGFGEAFSNKGDALYQLKRFDEARASYDQAIAFRPGFAELFNNKGDALYELKRFDEAVASYDQAIALKPGLAEAFSNKGDALYQLKRFDEALTSYDQAIALKPGLAKALNNKGNILNELERFDEGLVYFDRAIALKPDFAEAFNNRGNALKELRRIDEALASYDHAISFRPGFAQAFNNRALCKLLIGRYIEGWSDYEWRFEVSTSISRPIFPNWQGEDLAGRRVLVFAEQGLGDVIQFARYLPLLERNRCQLTFLAPAKLTRLTRLLRSLRSEIKVISALSPEHMFDYQCALMSLPHRLGTNVASIPNSVPYLHAEDDLIVRWKERLKKHGFKIGIAWQGNPLALADRGRSISLNEYVPLARIPGVRLISLQTGYGLDQLAQLPKDVTIEILGQDFDDGPDAFIDTAAVISSLDLVITADTAIAHLAGALGCRTWVTLKYVPHWPWMLDREDSPWYPTARLFRQSRVDDWAPVFANIANELRSLIRQFD